MPCLCGFPKTNPPKNASQKRDFHFSPCHCATPFDTFFVNPFDILLSSQNRSQNQTTTCTTHTPHPKMNFSRQQNHLPELLFSLFFPSLFRSSFRHFCHVLCDFYFSFQVPKPPVFAAFRLFQGYPDADSFSFFKTKNLISGESPETRFLVVLWYF